MLLWTLKDIKKETLVHSMWYFGFQGMVTSSLHGVFVFFQKGTLGFMKNYPWINFVAEEKIVSPQVSEMFYPRFYPMKGPTNVSRTPKNPEYLIALSRNLLGPGIRT